MRKVAYGLLALIVVIVGAALVVPSLIDWNAWKGEIAARAKQATGRDLDIRGDLDLAVLPSPRLTVRDVHLSNISGAGAPDMVALKSLDVRVRFAPLLSGRVEVESVTLVEPVIRLERLSDGRVNWRFDPPGAQTPPAPAPGGQTRNPTSGTASDAISLESVHIRNGTLIWHDAESGTTERIEELDTEIAARSLSGPFRLAGGLTVRNVPLALDLSVGRLQQPDSVPLTLRADVKDADARLQLSGTLSGLEETPRFTGKAEAKGESLHRLRTAVAGAAEAVNLPGFLAQPFRLQTRLDGTAAGIAADDLEIALGDTRAVGELTVDVGEKVKAELKLRGTAVDLDKWLAMEAPSPPAAVPSPTAGGGGRSAVSQAPPADDAPFTLPKGINASVDLRLDAAGWRGQPLRDLRFQAVLAEGEVTINQLAARLPGEAEASVFGFLSERNGKPNFDGALEARADNLRSTLDWLGADVSTVPADRLRKFALSAKLRGDARQVQVLDAKISLDTSRIDGGVTIALRSRPAFGASANINQLNLDAYLPAERTAAAARLSGVAETAERTVTAPPTELARGARTEPAGTAGGPLATLGTFDANIRLRVGSLTYRQTPVQGVRFDGTLAQGRLTVREAAVQSLAGTSASLKGELSGFDSLPVFRGSFSADSQNLAGLLRIAGLADTLSARRLGTMRLRGTAGGGAENVELDATLDIAGGRLALKGTAEGLTGKPQYNGTLTANHPEFADAVAAFGGPAPAQGRKLGPLVASLTVNGDLNAMTAEGRVRAAGGTLEARGRSENLLTAPGFDVTATASHPEFRDLARVFAPDWRAAAAKLGPFRMIAALKGTGEKATLPKLEASIGEMSLSGSGTLTLTGERPMLTGSFSGGVIDLNPLLPPSERKAASADMPPGIVLAAAAAPASGGAQSSPPFSAEPFGLSALGALDADVTLATNALIWRNFRVDNPQMKATLDNRLLRIEQLKGQMFDGAFLMKGSLNGRQVPALEASVTVDKANVGKALLQSAEFDVASGIMDFETALTAQGRSERALVAALNGQGKLMVRDGIVKGFDLKAVSDRLKELDKGLDFIRLLGSAMGGGDTKFSSLDGTFKVENGVLRTDDLTLVAEAGKGSAKGTANLPQWVMDFTTEFSLTEHPKAPPFGMRAVGPIDNPRRVFKFEQLQAYLLQRGIGSLLRKAIPEKTQEEGAQGGQQQKPSSPNPEDLLRGLLDGFRKR